jgi:hypothetical protein
MRLNPKEFQDYPLTFYYIEYLKPQEVEGATSKAKYSDEPIAFRCNDNRQGLSKELQQLIKARNYTNTGMILETRSDIKFKVDDIIITDLEKFQDEQKLKDGLPYVNRFKIVKVDNEIDKELSNNNMRRFTRRNDIIKVLVVT